MNFDTNKNENESDIKVRDPYFENYRNQIYEELQENPSLLFNFFLENNEYIKKINKEDEELLFNKYIEFNNIKKKIFLSTYLGIFLFDQVLLRYKFPNFKIQSFRIIINLFKYACLPVLIFGLSTDYIQKDLDQIFFDQAQKYNFNQDDFNIAFDSYEQEKLNGNLDYIINERNQSLYNRIFK